MKRILIVLLIIGFTKLANAQQNTFASNINRLNTAKTTEDFQKSFDGFSVLVKNNREAYYFSALSLFKKNQVLILQNKLSPSEDDINLAGKNVNASFVKNNNNIEPTLLLGFLHLQRMLANPEKYGNQSQKVIQDCISKVEKLDANNPRLALLKAEYAYLAPTQFGGNKENGIALLKESLKKFDQTTTNSNINWGKTDAEILLNK